MRKINYRSSYRYQLLNGYNGRVGLINSGGESLGESDLQKPVITAVFEQSTGGMGLILGRKATSV